MKDQEWRAIGYQYRKASDILTSTVAAFFLQPPNNGKGSRDSWTPVLADPGTRAHESGSVRHRMADARNGGPPEWQTPGMAAPRNGGRTSGMADPGMAAPGMAAPRNGGRTSGMADPGMAAPGMAGRPRYGNVP